MKCFNNLYQFRTEDNKCEGAPVPPEECRLHETLKEKTAPVFEVPCNEGLEAGLIDILQKNSDMSEGSCPWCGEEDYPVDEEGKRIEGPNVENAEEWRLDHADTCAVTLIEKLLNGNA